MPSRDYVRGGRRVMGALTIRNLDAFIERKLRARAAARGISIEDEVRAILISVVGNDTEPAPTESLMEAIDRLKAKHGAFELDIPPRSRATDRDDKPLGTDIA